MKIHAVAGTGNSTILVRETSCYCHDCLSGQRCNSWREDRTRKPSVGSTSAVSNVDSVVSSTEAVVQISVSIAAVYDSKWYVGKVLDTYDNEVEISFMEKKKMLFEWPRRVDKIWVSNSDVLCTIGAPKETGKSMRMYRLSESDHAKITQIFSSRQ